MLDKGEKKKRKEELEEQVIKDGVKDRRKEEWSVIILPPSYLPKMNRNNQDKEQIENKKVREEEQKV